jgi:hypothetical protein
MLLIFSFFLFYKFLCLTFNDLYIYSADNFLNNLGG